MTKIKSRTKFKKDLKWIMSSQYISKFITMPCSIITAKILGPHLYGTWNALKLIIRYFSILQLGTFDGLTREIPNLKGTKNNDEIIDCQETVFTFCVLVGLIGMVILYAYSYFGKEYFTTEMIVGIRVFAVVAAFYLIYQYYVFLLKAKSEFELLGQIVITYSTALSLVQVIAVLVYGMNGLFGAIVCVHVFIVILLYKKIPIPIGVFKINILKYLMRSGFPMLLNGIATILANTSDRIMILALLGRTQLGFYSIAVLGYNLILFMPSSLYTLILPRIMESYNNKNSIDRLNLYCLEPLFITTLILPLIASILSITTPLCIIAFLPKYHPSVKALIILLFGACFHSISMLTRNIFVAENKQYRVLVAYFIATFIGILLNYILVKLGFGINGVAFATSFSFFLLSIAMVIMAMKVSGIHKGILRVLIKINAPTIFLVCCVTIVMEIILPVSPNWQIEIINTIKRLCIFVIITLIFLLVNKKRIKKLAHEMII